ncbi:hypothetical protein GQ55_7G334000 [Panicum hallii var. hallii]|uniref:Uncharacterized protein n=1 Tax=Panicum hallii var. hallii TaxID=1504633 RepID=A0A2T7D1T5_9POAL|nr:hypothetical protein GQ55_7G334000 [Panicum hallii var. hallii]
MQKQKVRPYPPCASVDRCPREPPPVAFAWAAPRRAVACPSTPADPCWELACSGRALTLAARRGSAAPHPAVTVQLPPPPARRPDARAPRVAGGTGTSRSRPAAFPGSGI